MSHQAGRIQRFSGTPYEVGLSNGRLLGPRLEENIARYIQEFIESSDKFHVDLKKLHGEAESWLQSLPTRFQEEFAGIAAGSGLSLQRVAEWFFIEQCAVLRCSAFITRQNGRSWVGRNNDTVAPGMWGYATVRAINGRLPTLAFSREGDVFYPTGINQTRLWLHYNYLPPHDTLDASQPHIPPYVFMVNALETCRTLADVEKQLQTTQRSDGMMLFAVDGKNEAFAIFECGHRSYFRREAAGDWIVGTNHFCMCDDPDGPLEERPFSSLSRFKKLDSRLASFGNQNEATAVPAALISMLADDDVERRDAEFATVYANVVCPSTGKIWYTFGGWPAASQGRWEQMAWPWQT